MTRTAAKSSLGDLRSLLARRGSIRRAASSSIERQRSKALTLLVMQKSYATFERSLSSAVSFNIAVWRQASKAASVSAASLNSAASTD